MGELVGPVLKHVSWDDRLEVVSRTGRLERMISHKLDLYVPQIHVVSSLVLTPQSLAVLSSGADATSWPSSESSTTKIGP